MSAARCLALRCYPKQPSFVHPVACFPNNLCWVELPSSSLFHRAREREVHCFSFLLSDGVCFSILLLVSRSKYTLSHADCQKGLAGTDSESPSCRHLILRCLPTGVSHSPEQPRFLHPMLALPTISAGLSPTPLLFYSEIRRGKGNSCLLVESASPYFSSLAHKKFFDMLTVRKGWQSQTVNRPAADI